MLQCKNTVLFYKRLKVIDFLMMIYSESYLHFLTIQKNAIQQVLEDMYQIQHGYSFRTKNLAINELK